MNKIRLLNVVLGYGASFIISLYFNFTNYQFLTLGLLFSISFNQIKINNNE